MDNFERADTNAELADQNYETKYLSNVNPQTKLLLQ